MYAKKYISIIYKDAQPQGKKTNSFKKVSFFFKYLIQADGK